jgi:hypothetical protein
MLFIGNKGMPGKLEGPSRWQRIRSGWNELRPSVRWIICTVVAGWAPVFGAEILRRKAAVLGISTDELAGFGLGWGLWITIPCSLVAGALVIYELIRFIVTTFWGNDSASGGGNL